MRVGILASHPIQYQAPWFRALAKEVDLCVSFAHRPNAREQAVGFGQQFEWDVDLLSGYNYTFFSNVARDPNVNHFFGCDTPQIREVVGEAKFDAFVVTGWNLKSYWQAVWACRRNKIPVLVRGDSQLQTPRSRLLGVAKELVYRIMLRQFDGFLTVGKRNREYLKHYGVSEVKMFSAPHFVDNERFAQQAREIADRRWEIRKEWGIPENAFCVLFCGKFIPKKRPLDLVKAAQLLIDQKRLANVHLLFVGSGELGIELRARCSVVHDAEAPNFQLPSAISQKPAASFAGFLNQTEISKAYVAADVLALPSNGEETWGLVVNEAMACGLPAIVSSAVGCCPDLIDEGRTGFTFPVADVATLAKKIEEMTRLKAAGFDFKPVLSEKMATFSIDAAVCAFIRAVEVVIKKRSARVS